ncbi:MAG: DUF4115 domain-containing protein [Streptosporangiales bacterium]|nr:DUF4115 domain-containing protein [Streptosporangiales bacterium]
MSIGETLASAREDSGLTIGYVSGRTRIREAVIAAMERDDFSLCGGDFYARGHIRTLARTVGIDPEPLIEEFDAEHGGPPQHVVKASDVFDAETPVSIRDRRKPNWSAAMAAALVIVVGYGIFQFSRDEGRATEGRAAIPAVAASPTPSATPTPTTPTEPPPRTFAQGKEVRLEVEALEPTWMSVRDAGDDEELFSGMLDEGKTRTWMAEKELKIVVGNAGGVKLMVNGKDLGKPGRSGEVMNFTFGPGDPTAG